MNTLNKTWCSSNDFYFHFYLKIIYSDFNDVRSKTWHPSHHRLLFSISHVSIASSFTDPSSSSIISFAAAVVCWSHHMLLDPPLWLLSLMNAESSTISWISAVDASPVSFQPLSKEFMLHIIRSLMFVL